MSVREATLCDLLDWSDKRCEDKSVGVCFICEKDVCARHIVAPSGGLFLHLFYVTDDRKCEHDGSKTPQRSAVFEAAVKLCFRCRADINKISSLSATDVIGPALLDAAKTAIKAALVAKGLE